MFRHVSSVVFTTLNTVFNEGDSVISRFEQTNVAVSVLNDVSTHEQVTELLSQLDEANKNAALVVLLHHFSQDLNGTSVHIGDVTRVNDDGVELPTTSLITRVSLRVTDSLDTRKHLLDHFDVGEVKSFFDTDNKNTLV